MVDRGTSGSFMPALDREAAGTQGTVVAVLTYRRPRELATLLPQLVRQAEQIPHARVLVVDNDPALSAREVVAALDAASVDVSYVHEPRPGIATARNRALDEAAGARLLVFIDDDEEPVSDWLSALVATWRASRPAAVVGPVRSTFAQEPPPFVQAGRFFDRRQLPTGAEVRVAATNNLLLDLQQVGTLRFDAEFGLSGGSDTLFTRQLAGNGRRMVWCNEALVLDRVPASRITAKWVLLRALRSGNSWSRTSVHLTPGPLRRSRVRVQLSAAGAVRTAGGAGRAVAGCVLRRQTLQAQGLRTAMRGLGMLLGAYGYVYAEYRRPAASRQPA